MTMEKQPFEDVSPIKIVILHCHVSFRGGKSQTKMASSSFRC